MIARLVREALERGVMEAAPEAAFHRLTSAGGLRARLAARRVRGLLARADAAIAADSADQVGRRVHTLQLAWLRAAGVPWDGLTSDARAASDAFYAHARGASPPPRRPRRRALGIAVVALAAAAVVAGILLLGPGGPRWGDGPVGRALTADLTDWVVQLDRWAPHGQRASADVSARASLDAARAAVLSPDAVAALGPASDALNALLDATAALAAEPDYPAGLPPRVDAFRAALREANAAFEAAGHPYFLDGDWLPHAQGYAQTTLFVFGVEARHRVAVEPAVVEPVTALHLRRLDNLNWSWSKLGYTRKAMDVAAVVLDKVEDQLITYVGPALTDAAPMPLVDPDSRTDAAAWQREVQRAAGEVARAAFARALPGEEARLAAFGAALDARRVRFASWRARLSRDGLVLSVPGTLRLGDELYASLRAALPDYQVTELEDVQRDVESSANRDIFARMLARYAGVVEAHEVQHRLDYARGDGFPVPDVVRGHAIYGGAESSAAESLVERVNYELSAYLSDVARDPSWSRLSLTLLVRNLLDRRGPRVEATVAELVLDGLAAELDLAARLGATGAVRRAAAEVYLALLDVPEDRLAAAAEALWQRWYDAPLVRQRRLDDAG